MRTAADFGYRVREERERQGITQATLASRADVSIRWLSNFERGKSPRAELIKVVHVARALGLVFTLTEDTPPTLSEAQQRLLASARKGLPSTNISSALTQLASATSDQMNQQLTTASLQNAGNTIQHIAKAMVTVEPLSPSAMNAMQSMLKTIGRVATEPPPSPPQEEGNDSAEA